MEQKVLDLMTEEVLEKIASKYSITKKELQFIRDFENFIYGFKQGEMDCILRVTHSSHRNEREIMGEIDWINYLFRGGARLSQAIVSKENRYVERVDVADSYFLATAFEKATGSLPDRKDPEVWNNTLFETWGSVVGQMHRLTKEYVPDPTFKRFEWHEDDLLANGQQYIEFLGKTVLKKQEEIINWAHRLPKDKDSYGLVHTDVHDGNFFVDNGKITVFDFDDCAYNWFMNDISIVLFYVLWMKDIEERDSKRRAYAENFITHFMKGYNKENQIDEYWMQHMSNFLKLREMTVLTVVCKKWDLNNLNEHQEAFIKSMKYNIENDIPYISK